METPSVRQVPRSLEQWLTLERALESLAGPGQHWSLPLPPLPTPAFLMHWVWVLIICLINKFPGDGGEGTLLGVTGGRRKQTGLVRFQDCDGFRGEKGGVSRVVRAVVFTGRFLRCSSAAFPGSRQGGCCLSLTAERAGDLPKGPSRQACELGSEPRWPLSHVLRCLPAR